MLEVYKCCVPTPGAQRPKTTQYSGLKSQSEGFSYVCQVVFWWWGFGRVEAGPLAAVLCCWLVGWVLEESEELAGDVALKDPAGFSAAFAFGSFLGHEGLGLGVLGNTHDCNGV